MHTKLILQLGVCVAQFKTMRQKDKSSGLGGLFIGKVSTFLINRDVSLLLTSFLFLKMHMLSKAAALFTS